MAIQRPITLGNISEQTGDVTQAAINRNLSRISAQSPEVVSEEFSAGRGNGMLQSTFNGLTTIANALTASERRDATQRNADLAAQKEAEQTAYARAQDQLANSYKQQQLQLQADNINADNARADKETAIRVGRYNNEQKRQSSIDGFNSLISNALMNPTNIQDVAAELANYAKDNPAITPSMIGQGLETLRGAELAVGQTFTVEQDAELKALQDAGNNLIAKAGRERDSAIAAAEADYPQVNNVSSKQQAAEGKTINHALKTLQGVAPDDSVVFTDNKSGASGQDIALHLTGDPTNPKDTGIYGKVKDEFAKKFADAGVPLKLDWAFASAAEAATAIGNDNFGIDTRDIDMNQYEANVKSLLNDYLQDVRNRELKLMAINEAEDKFNRASIEATKGYNSKLKEYTQESLKRFQNAVNRRQ